MSQDKNAPNLLSDWIRLQADFQARLTDETFRYLRRLQGAVAPVTPGTVLLPEEGTDLKALATPGGAFEITLEVKNDQRVHAAVVPALDPLVSVNGATWYPDVQFSPEFSLVAPEETLKLLIRVSVPPALPEGTYVGALSLRGLQQQAFRLSVEIHRPGAKPSERRPNPTAVREGKERTVSGRAAKSSSKTAAKASRKAR
jgi:hypothetical protein